MRSAVGVITQATCLRDEAEIAPPRLCPIGVRTCNLPGTLVCSASNPLVGSELGHHVLVTENKAIEHTGLAPLSRSLPRWSSYLSPQPRVILAAPWSRFDKRMLRATNMAVRTILFFLAKVFS